MVASIIGQKLSVRDVEGMMKSMKNSSADTSKKEQKERFDLSALTNCFKELGFKAKAKSNEITLSFENEEAIQKLLDRLN